MADAASPLRGSPADAPSFSAFFPPPYRVLLLVSIGLTLSASNFHLLGRRGIDLWALIGNHEPTGSVRSDGDADHNIGKAEVLPITSRSSEATPNRHLSSSPHHHLATITSAAAEHRGALSFYLAGICGLAWSLLGWLSYRYYVDRLSGDSKGRHAQALQAIAVLGAFGALLWPGNVLNRAGRKAFGRSILRILTPSILQTITFADVLLADVLTSFAKVLGDVWLTACFLVPRAEQHTWWNGKGSVVVPLLMSLPYAIRLRQCLSEYNVTNSARSSPRSARPLTGGGGKVEATNKKPLWNAAKYASAFPVIWLSVWYDADKVVGPTSGGSREWNATFNFWLLSVFVNSLYSFWWDVTNDWGLSVLSISTLVSASHGGSISSNGNLRSNKTLHKRGVSSFSFLQHHGHRKGEASSEDEVLMHPLESIESGDSIDASPSSSSSLFSHHHLTPFSASGHARKPSLLERVLRPSPSPSSHGGGGTSSLLFHPTTYQLAILVDLVLRFFWSLKLSSHLYSVVEWQGGVFVMEALEILRRWIWVFFRVEWEVVRRGRMVGGGGTARLD